MMAGSLRAVVLATITFGLCIPQSALADCPAREPSGPPKERSGVSPSDLATIKLPADFDMTGGRELRMRKATIAPGGGLPMHAHDERPAVAYVLSGALTEYRGEASEPRVLLAGQANEIFRDAHALQNRGDVPVVFIEVDLPVGQK